MGLHCQLGGLIVVDALAIDHHTFKQQRIAHDCIEGGLVVPGKDCWVEASHHVWIGERQAATNAVLLPEVVQSLGWRAPPILEERKMLRTSAVVGPLFLQTRNVLWIAHVNQSAKTSLVLRRHVRVIEGGAHRMRVELVVEETTWWDGAVAQRSAIHVRCPKLGDPMEVHGDGFVEIVLHLDADEVTQVSFHHRSRGHVVNGNGLGPHAVEDGSRGRVCRTGLIETVVGAIAPFDLPTLIHHFACLDAIEHLVEIHKSMFQRWQGHISEVSNTSAAVSTSVIFNEGR
mmetsp:Transcript_30660/g.66053  ORF Transcript_30660/g.66053 Transcript_30660/m.66053 type:complete len:287 (+) Transcript_30660:1511-2371(+)